MLQALKAAFPILPKWRKPAPLHQDPYQALISGQAGHDSEVPIFVIGMPRSGSTLVEQILASHSRVFGAGESCMVPRGMYCSLCVPGYCSADLCPAVQTFIKHLCSSKLLTSSLISVLCMQEPVRRAVAVLSILLHCS